MREVESFFPTYETTHVWRNRQRKTIVLPLFPSYVFVRICRSQRGAVLSSPGVVRIAGNNAGPMAIPDPEVEFLRSERYRNRLKPFHDMVIGERVRVARGTMEGVEGVLIRRENDSLRFVLRVDLIQQSVSVEIPAEDLQPAPAKDRFGVGQTVQCRPSPSRPVRTWTPA
jgi:transcription antitermination factor NusG